MSAHQLQAFQEVSGCTDTDEAKHFLDACNGDVERAINLFFTQSSRKKQDGSFKSIAGPSTSASAQRARASANNASMIELSDDDELPIRNEDGVRAPIAPIQGAIVEQSFQQAYGTRRGNSNPIFEQFRDFRELAEQQDNNLRRRIAHNSRAAGAVSAVDLPPVASRTRNGVPAQSSDALFSSNGVSHRGERNGETSRHAAKAARDLKALFRPPLEIMYQKEWDQTIFYARQQKRWLLVNVQMAAEFACQVLNRDIWSEATVQEIIRENFVFWQTYYDSPSGARVCGYYEIREFPAIFIVDPRTGEEVKKLRAPDAVSFLDQVTDFLDNYPTFEARDAEICGRSMPQNGTTNTSYHKDENSPNDTSNNRRRKRKSDCKILVENGYSADTAAAAAAAAAVVSADCDANLQAKRMKRIVNINDADHMAVDEPCTSSSSSEKLMVPSADEWKNYIGHKYAHSQPVQVLLKLPNSEKQCVSVLNTTTLKALFMYIAGRNLSPKEYHFVLSFPKRVFTIDHQEQTLAAAGFALQEVVHVEKI